MVLASAASAVAILGGWQLGTSSTATLVAGGTASADAATEGSGTGGSTTASGTQAGASADAARAEQSTAATAAADGTYTGTTVSTRFGDVQVQVTISGGAITDVSALRLTDHDGRSVSISNRAAPLLRDEVLAAQAASVSMISGATYTSSAYLQSLQAALDEAGYR